MKTFSTSACLLLLALAPLRSPAQVLQNIGEALSSATENAGSGSNDGDLFWLDLLIQFGYYPTVGLLFGFEGEPEPNASDFAPFPYADPQVGLHLPEDEPGDPVRFHAAAHLQSNEDALYGGFVQLKFSPNRFLTADVNRLQLFETLDDGSTDRLAVTNFNLLFSRIRGTRFHGWWGGGLMLLDYDLLYGSPSFSAGFDWFFKKPLSFHAETQVGFPNDVVARQSQLRLQAHLGRFMIYAGMQGLRVGEVRERNWAMGTGVWF